MLSFASNLRPHTDAFVVFVTEKYDYKDKRHILPSNTVQKINSFLRELKLKKKEEDISSIDISNQQKCFCSHGLTFQLLQLKNQHQPI